MIASIARQLSHLLESSVLVGGHEPAIVKRFVNNASSIQYSSRFKIESIFVHQKPYAFFVTPSTNGGKKKCELGDILLITKRIRAGGVIDHRFLFLQAKKLSGGVGLVEVHQFKFYRDIGGREFKFGNSVYANSQRTPLNWKGLTKSGWFGSYLFLDSPASLCASTSLINTQYNGGCRAFKFAPPILMSCPFGSSHFGIHSFESFLRRFLQPNGIGVGVSPSNCGFLEIVLKHVGWIVDPPEETEGYFEDDKEGGLGIIRVTINDDENGMRPSTEYPFCHGC